MRVNICNVIQRDYFLRQDTAEAHLKLHGGNTSDLSITEDNKEGFIDIRVPVRRCCLNSCLFPRYTHNIFFKRIHPQCIRI